MQAQRPGNILVVDADTNFLTKTAETLGAQGHRVQVATAVYAACGLMEKTLFDVVVCAFALPDQNGAQLCRLVKSSERPEPVFTALLIDITRDGAEAEALFQDYFAPTPREHPHGEPDAMILKPVWPEILAGHVLNLLRARRYLEECNNAVTALMAVAQGVEEQDRSARGHCQRLALMSLELGAVLGCDDWELTALERGSYLHDIGMATIHGALTHKNGNFSPHEREMVKAHTLRGEALCCPVAALLPVLPIIRSHHERGDGTGYPDGLRSNDIPRLAQIFAIPHLYEALRLWRSYRVAGTEVRAIEVMREEVKWGYWNATYFDAFVGKVLPGLDDRLDEQHILWLPASSR